jgi:polar amino acid transport system substrate-binding protein
MRTPASRPLGRLLVSCLLVVTLGACQSLSSSAPSEAAASAPDRIERILSSGELRVGLTGSQPPMNMRNKTGEIVGLEVDLVQALAKSMGLEARLMLMPFADLLPALERGDLDMVVSGMTITPERNARVAFAGPYFISGKSVLSKSEKLAKVTDATVLDDPARSYAALKDSTSEQFVKDVMPKAKLVATDDYDEAVQMVIDGSVDALIADFQICAVSVFRYPEAELSALMTPFTVEPIGIALPADSPLLVNLVDNYLDTLEYTGLLARYKAKWMSHGPWVDELP